MGHLTYEFSGLCSLSSEGKLQFLHRELLGPDETKWEWRSVASKRHSLTFIKSECPPPALTPTRIHSLLQIRKPIGSSDLCSASSRDEKPQVYEPLVLRPQSMGRVHTTWCKFQVRAMWNGWNSVHSFEPSPESQFICLVGFTWPT